MMVIWRDWELVVFHHLGKSVTVYAQRLSATASSLGLPHTDISGITETLLR